MFTPDLIKPRVLMLDNFALPASDAGLGNVLKGTLVAAGYDATSVHVQ